MEKPVNGKITAGFDELRPLSKPKAERDHKHGAVDIRARVGSIIKAPESGTCFAYIGIRPKDGLYWPEIPVIYDRPFYWRNYFYDMYGGIIVLLAHNGNPKIVTLNHIMAHCYGNQIFNDSILGYFPQHWIEEKEDKRFPIHGNYSDPIVVEEGDPIGFVGNAGFSTGPHLHHEIHHGYIWEVHENRVNPEDYF